MRELKNTAISFIIPALNEERHLPRLLHTINEMVTGVGYEIILVDNGSHDLTVKIAKDAGAKVLIDDSVTISGLRNLGARNAQGEVLVFMDADMYVTRSWAEQIGETIKNLCQNKNTITGSRAGISEEESWIERYWFLPMTKDRNPKYINSGHLIVRKDMFNEIGGFDEHLTTGEDWEFCMRAKKMGVSIVTNPALLVIHDGYPRSLRAFVLREKWHGAQDFSTFSTFWASLPAQMAVIFWLVWILGAVWSLYYWSISCLVAAVAINASLCLISTIRRSRDIPLKIPYYFILFHAYYFARGLSLKDRLLAHNAHPHR